MSENGEANQDQALVRGALAGALMARGARSTTLDFLIRRLEGEVEMIDGEIMASRFSTEQPVRRETLEERVEELASELDWAFYPTRGEA